MQRFHEQLFAAAIAVFDDDTDMKGWEPPVIDGVQMGRGLSERDFAADPRSVGAMEFPDELLIPESDIKEALKDQIGFHSSLLDLRDNSDGALDSLNQTNHSLCWAFSSTKASMYCDATSGNVDPTTGKTPRRSAWYVAGMIKGWKDQGGWGEASTKFIADKGAPLYDFCPEYSKSAIKPGCVEDAAKRKVTEFWIGSGDKEKRAHQYISALLQNFGTVVDLNWMGHSMAGCCLVEFSSFTKFATDADNSWGMKSGVKGLYRLKDGKSIPDDLIIQRVTRAAA